MYSKLLSALKISALNPMQLEVIEAAGKHEDIILLSPTGSGKTLAFLIPLVQRLTDEEKVQAMIIVPTRELVLQIEQVLRSMSSGFKVVSCYGGHDFSIERKSLSPAPAVIVGTPGRLADHLRRETILTDYVNTLVLDEFDKSLEMGFQNEMSFIISKLPFLKHRMLTSATELKELPDYTLMRKPHRISYLLDATSSSGLKLKYVVAKGKDKLEVLFRLLCRIGDDSSIVFCNHREAVDRVSEVLHESRIPHAIFHGGLEQEEREKALIGLRNGSQKILLTTDLASRGLDVPEIGYVIHYQLPPNEQTFIHRNGRTARMQASGVAYLVLSSEEYLPPFLNETPEKEELALQYPLPPQPAWTTLYIAAGKKDKVNKVDVVGFLSQKGKLEKHDIGLIEVKDHACYVAVRREKVKAVLESVSNEKIKNKKVKIGVSYSR